MPRGADGPPVIFPRLFEASPAAPMPVVPAPMPSMMPSRSVEAGAIKAIGAIARAPPAPAPGITNPANLIDVRCLGGVLCGGQPVRHRRRGDPGNHRCAAKCHQSYESCSKSHLILLYEIKTPQDGNSFRGDMALIRFNPGERLLTLKIEGLGVDSLLDQEGMIAGSRMDCGDVFLVVCYILFAGGAWLNRTRRRMTAR